MPARHLPLPSVRAAALLLALALLQPLASAQDPDAVVAVDAQPLRAQVKRLSEALEFLGEPLPAADLRELRRAADLDSPGDAVRTIQEVLRPHVLLEVNINPESRVKVAAGAAAPELLANGWRLFLVRVHNEAGITAALDVSSPQDLPVYVGSTGASEPPPGVSAAQISDRWLDMHQEWRPPLSQRLSGLALEYRVLQLYSRDAGFREATFRVNAGQGTQDLGFRSETSIVFRCTPSIPVEIDVHDFDGGPVMAAFEIRDAIGRVYPTPSKRLAPDFFFHPQVYRQTGETVDLPPGAYSVTVTRGPEYRVLRTGLVVPEGVERHSASFQLERWIHPKEAGWYSGDHHVHGGGCSHYESPSAGVSPEDMRRHQLGEDLNVACLLSWGPCWYFQKQFFDGQVHELSTADYQMRYDVEVSGFPSQHCGHLCLLRLQEDDYPGTERIEDWPSWDLPILKWAKAQGGVVGFSHSGWGLQVGTDELPNYEVPPFDGIGANEFIVDVTHDAVDFISMVDTPHVWELNIWYHTLNCGFRTRISGETDFPCIYGERIGLGRVYCKLDGPLDFDQFCEAIKQGRSYVSDGLSHLLDFRAGDREAGTGGSELRLPEPGTITVSARAAALLETEPVERIRSRPYFEKPYWHVERARVGDTRKVPVELIVNGQAVQRTEILADGSVHDVSFEVPVEVSSWIALRILPSSHTNPVFVVVGGQPVRASRRSAQWCLDSVERCWESKRGNTRAAERTAMRKAYDSAAASYRAILAECVAD